MSWDLPCDVEDEGTCPQTGLVKLLRLPPDALWSSEDDQTERLQVPAGFQVANLRILEGETKCSARFGVRCIYDVANKGSTDAVLSVAFVAPGSTCSMKFSRAS